LENIAYAYNRAKIHVLEESLAKQGAHFDSKSSPATQPATGPLTAVLSDPNQVAQLRSSCETLTAFWKAAATTTDPARRAELVERYGAQLAPAAKQLSKLIER
jgi:hypothetical protein